MENRITFETLPEYFDFFEAIPEKNWCVGAFEVNGKRCAIGHVTDGAADNGPYNDLHPLRFQLKIGKFDASDINNGGYLFIGDNSLQELGDTPKERILNAIVLIESGILSEVE